MGFFQPNFQKCGWFPTTLFASKINDQFTTLFEFGCLIQCYIIWEKQIDLKNVEKSDKNGAEQNDKDKNNLDKSDKNAGGGRQVSNKIPKTFKKEKLDPESQKVAWSTGRQHKLIMCFHQKDSDAKDF